SGEHRVGVLRTRGLHRSRQTRTRGQTTVIVVRADDLHVGGRPSVRVRGETQDDRVVVGRTVGAGLVEVRAVVVATAVLQGQGLTGVDAPDVRAGRALERGVVHQDVVQRAGEAREGVGELT